MKIVINQPDITTFYANENGEHTGHEPVDAEVELDRAKDRIYSALDNEYGDEDDSDFFSVSNLRRFVNNADNFDSEHDQFYSTIVGYIILMDAVIKYARKGELSYPFTRAYAKVDRILDIAGLRQHITGVPVGNTIDMILTDEELSAEITDIPQRDDFTLINDFDLDVEAVHELGRSNNQALNTTFLLKVVDDIGHMIQQVEKGSKDTDLNMLDMFTVLGHTLNTYAADKRSAVWVTCLSYLAFSLIAPHVGASNLDLERTAEQAKQILRGE